MEQLPALGTSIADIVAPTFGIYAPLLQRNADQIRSVRRDTYSYGPTARQQLDVYTPSQPSSVNGRRAVLIWLYGGGLVRGEKQMPGGGGLMHANVGSFFASRCGYTVVVPDYRLVGTHADARFPSGGEDVALTVAWIREHRSELVGGGGGGGDEDKDEGDDATPSIDLFAMGNSAGAVHLSTFMLHPQFADTRRSVLTATTTTTTGEPLCRLRGVVLLSAPLDFSLLQAYRRPTIEAYYADADAQGPLGLLRSARETGSLDFLGGGGGADGGAGCRVLVLNAELDPWDEIQSARDKFIHEWMRIGSEGSRNALAVDTMIGHNHISPCCALGTGIEQEEAWGFQVAAFIENLRKFMSR